MKRIMVGLMIACILLSLGACGKKDSADKEQLDFQKTLDECLEDEDFKKFVESGELFRATFDEVEGDIVEGFSVEDNGNTLIFESGDQNVRENIRTYRLEIMRVMCNRLGISDGTMEKISKTRALDGTQTDETDELKLTWNYHPDKGLNLIIEKKK